MPKRLFPKDFPAEYKPLMPYLTWAEQRIIEFYYGIDTKRLKTHEVAEKMQTSAYTVRKSLRRAFSKLEKLPKQ